MLLLSFGNTTKHSKYGYPKERGRSQGKEGGSPEVGVAATKLDVLNWTWLREQHVQQPSVVVLELSRIYGRPRKIRDGIHL